MLNEMNKKMIEEIKFEYNKISVFIKENDKAVLKTPGQSINLYEILFHTNWYK